MTIVIIIIHVVICVALIALVLIQRGRGAGLVESFQGVESMFGPKTNVFLTRLTTVLSSLFFLTCLSLAVLSVRQSRSLMRNIQTKPAPTTPIAQTTKADSQKALKPEEKVPAEQGQVPQKQGTQNAEGASAIPEAPKAE